MTDMRAMKQCQRHISMPRCPFQTNSHEMDNFHQSAMYSDNLVDYLWKHRPFGPIPDVLIAESAAEFEIELHQLRAHLITLSISATLTSVVAQ